MLCVHTAACTVPRIEGRGKPGPCCGWKQQKKMIWVLGICGMCPEIFPARFTKGQLNPKHLRSPSGVVALAPSQAPQPKLLIFVQKHGWKRSPCFSALVLLLPNRAKSLPCSGCGHSQTPADPSRAAVSCQQPHGPPRPLIFQPHGPNRIGVGFFRRCSPHANSAAKGNASSAPAAEQAHSVPSPGPVVNPFASLSSPPPCPKRAGSHHIWGKRQKTAARSSGELGTTGCGALGGGRGRGRCTKRSLASPGDPGSWLPIAHSRKLGFYSSGFGRRAVSSTAWPLRSPAPKAEGRAAESHCPVSASLEFLLRDPLSGPCFP